MLCLALDTDAAWAEVAATGLERILADHAHCEMKAAANALSLASRPPASMRVAQALAALAQEETEHFQQVLALLVARGARLGPPPEDGYVVALRRAASSLARPPALSGFADRLLVASLIEARSCERFRRLLEVLDPAREPDVHALYERLFRSEARHHRCFVDWAIEENQAPQNHGTARASSAPAGGPAPAAGEAEAAVRARLAQLAIAEAGIVRGLVDASAARDRCAIHG
jgi:tRNA-(ms[2]io[6]A)-hydroxylase